MEELKGFLCESHYFFCYFFKENFLKAILIYFYFNLTHEKITVSQSQLNFKNFILIFLENMTHKFFFF